MAEHRTECRGEAVDYLRLHGSEPKPLWGARLSPTREESQPIQVAVVLRYPETSPGLPSLSELGRPGSGRPATLSAERFGALHGAAIADVDALLSFARDHGLAAPEICRSKRTVVLEGSRAALNRAFRVELVDYDHPRGRYRSHHGPVHLPAALAPLVVGVFGLDSRPVARPHVRRPSLPERAPTLGGSAEPLLPTQVAELYRFPREVSGRGQAVGIIELGGGYVRSDLVDYFEKVVQRPLPRIVDVSVGAGRNLPGHSEECDNEVALDIEVLGSIAYGAEIFVFFAPPTQDGFLRAVQEAVHGDYDLSVLSISWGEPEETQTLSACVAMNQVLHEAATKGITVCISTGDTGSSDQSPMVAPDGYAHVSFPASSPYALACGGTSLVALGGQGPQEVVWNNAAEGGGATGGGVSAFFPRPGYQRAAGLCPQSVNPGRSDGRGIPDVAASADPHRGYLVQVAGQLKPTGGTSAAAPLWAALIALVNERCGQRRGFINPSLYRMGKHSAAFRDITEGDNATAMLVGGYGAAQGWDPCTGWGSPDGQALSHLLPRDQSPPREPGPSPLVRWQHQRAWDLYYLEAWWWYWEAWRKALGA